MLPTLFAGLIAAAWLLPNHYLPWLAAWGDGMAIAGLLLLLAWAALRAARGARLSWPVLMVVALSGAVLLAQTASGKIMFTGDGLMAALYLSLWLAAVLVGESFAAADDRDASLRVLCGVWVFAALASVGIALAQWTGAVSLGIYGADLPPNGRPFGNIGQPNHLCTICFLGLCGLAWLHERRRVNGLGFWLGAAFLLVGMVMTQSRTGWLQIGLLVVWLVAMHRRAGLRISQSQVLLLGVGFAALTVAWPLVCDGLLLSSGRALNEQLEAGKRSLHWAAMIDAIGREPWWGYGWQQVNAAQQSVAVDHPWVGEQIDHSHNLVLDLLLWNGIPVGGLIVLALAAWFVLRIRTCRDARVTWLLAAVGGVFTHAMLEYPLEYAYFLIPVGLAMGAIDGLSPHGRSVPVARSGLLVAACTLALVFAWVGSEYLQAEQNERMLRLESARIGVAGIVTPAPDLRLLTQLEAYLQFARTEAEPGMTPEKLDWMRKVSERYGYPPVMLRYALAAGLNGRPRIAEQTLARLCKIQPKQMCVEIRKAWAAMARQQPLLRGISLPQLP